MKKLSSVLVVGIAAVMLANIAGGAGPAAAAVAPGITIEIDRTELHCNGDSTRVTIHAKDVNGVAAGHANVSLFVFPGTVTANGHTYESGEVAGQTDSRGDFTARVTPAPGTHDRWDIFVMVDGLGISYPTAAACDFSTDRAYVLAGEIFRDANSDGVRNAGERAARRTEITITKAYSFGSWVPIHTQRTAFDGSFEWAGLSQDQVPGRSPWHLCLTDPRLAFTSVNGVEIEPAACVSTDLTPGVTSLSLGVGGAR